MYMQLPLSCQSADVVVFVQHVKHKIQKNQYLVPRKKDPLCLTITPLLQCNVGSRRNGNAEEPENGALLLGGLAQRDRCPPTCTTSGSHIGPTCTIVISGYANLCQILTIPIVSSNHNHPCFKRKTPPSVVTKYNVLSKPPTYQSS